MADPRPVVAPEIAAYAEQHTTPPPEHLRRLAEETRASLPSPGMLSGELEGRFLETLVAVSGAERVLELGTYSGYGTLSMAAGLAEGGTVTTCEVDPETADFARRHIEGSGLADRVDLRVGPALETLETLDGPFDFIFIDADKVNYARYYEACLPLLADGGLMAVDNTLWGWRVLDEHADDSDATRAIRELNDQIASDERVVAVVLPVRDGVTLVRHRR
ncbi:MAG: O-methyltransferase [Thermoleophilaceae bacterium]